MDVLGSSPRDGPKSSNAFANEDLLPAIYFIFSRNACDEAAQRCFAAGLRLTNTEERTRIREIIESCTEALSDADLGVLNFDHWREVYRERNRGASRWNGSSFREAVELCFVEGLIKVVFATETLAMGINMPARRSSSRSYPSSTERPTSHSLPVSTPS